MDQALQSKVLKKQRQSPRDTWHIPTPVTHDGLHNSWDYCLYPRETGRYPEFRRERRLVGAEGGAITAGPTSTNDRSYNGNTHKAYSDDGLALVLPFRASSFLLYELHVVRPCLHLPRER